MQLFSRKHLQENTIRHELVVPPHFTAIEDGLFENNVELKTVWLNNVTHIGRRAFYGSGITAITLAETVEAVGDEAFANCRALEEVHIYESPSLGDGCFENSLVSKLSAPNLWCFPARCFYGTALKSMVFAEHVTTIGKEAFAACKELEKIVIGGNPELGIGCFENSNVVTLKFSNMEHIPARAFAHTRLQVLLLPPSLQVIDTEAFMNSNLLRIDSSACSKLTSIGARAFYGAELSMVFLGCKLEFLGKDAFAENPNLYAIRLGNCRQLHTLGDVYLAPDGSRHPHGVVHELAAMYPKVNVITIDGYTHTRDLY